MKLFQSIAACLIAGATILPNALESQPNDATLPTPQKFVLEAGPHDAIDVLNQLANFLQRNILWNEQDFSNPGMQPFTLQNRVELDPRGAEAFVGQLFYTRNFAFVPLDVGRGLWQLINMQGSQRGEIMSRPLTMSAEKVLANADMYYPVRCTVPLKHIRAMTATTTLRPFFHSSGSSGGLVVGNVGNEDALLLQGFANQVAGAIELLRSIDAGRAQEVSRFEDRLQKIEARIQLLEGPGRGR